MRRKLLRTIGFLGDWETAILSLLSNISSIILFCFQPRVALKIENVKFDKKQVNDILGYYLTATILNKGKKIAFNIDAHFDIKDDSGKTPSLLHVETETICGQKNVRVTEKPFEEDIGYAWVLKGENYRQGSPKELRHDDKVDLRFPYNPMGIAFGKAGQGVSRSYLSEFL